MGAGRLTAFKHRRKLGGVQNPREVLCDVHTKALGAFVSPRLPVGVQWLAVHSGPPEVNNQPLVL